MKVCRTCANSDANQSPLWRLFDMRKKHLLQYIQMFTGLLLTRQIGMPEYICDTCLQDLKRAIKFRKRCIKTQKELSHNCTVNSVRRDKKPTNGTDASVISFPIERIPECESELINITTEYDNFVTESTAQEESAEVETPNEFDVNLVKTVVGTEDNVISFTIERMAETHIEFSNITTVDGSVNNFEEVLIEEVSTTDEQMWEIEYVTSETEYDDSGTTTHEKPSENIQETLKKPIKKIDGPVVCEYCGKSFNFVGNFREHQLRHSGIKNFGCHLCNYKFFTNKELVRHIRRHTGERPYACTYCDSRFADLSTKAQHEKRHMDERHFKCEECSKTFVTSGCLKKHMLTHTGIRDHCCTVCDQWFLRRTHLSTHLRSKGHIQNLATQEQNKQSDKEK